MSHYLIGDDLSGVLEAGAAFRAQGWRVVLPLAGPGGPAGTGELRLVTTESRNLAAGDATAAVRRAIAQGRAEGGRLLFKKIDSTLRGPIGAELAAVVAELAPPLIVFCPANPGAGRTVRHGVLRVYGVPVTGTEFQRDPHWPATESRVRELLVAQGVTVAGLVKLPELRRDAGAALGRLREAAPGGVVVSDAENDADLLAIARAARAIEPDTLFVGSGALAAVVAGECSHPGRSMPPLPRLSSLLILCGSAHPANERQLAHAARTTGVHVHEIFAGRDDLAGAVAAVERDYRARGVTAVRMRGGDGTGAASAQLLDAVAKLAAALDERLQPEAYFVTGGETAWRVCHALQGSSLEVLAEVEPGVVVSILRLHERASRTLITKPGGFGDEATLSRLLGR